MEIVPKYDVILRDLLTQHDLEHGYHQLADPGEFYRHQILTKNPRVLEEPFLFFFKRRRIIKDVVAEIKSEPRLAETQHNHVTSLLKYSGLEIHVVDSEYVPQMRSVCTQLEEQLKEPVKLVV